MTKQEKIELCELLVKLLGDINDDDSDEVFNECIMRFTIAGKRIKTTITFEIGESDE